MKYENELNSKVSRNRFDKIAKMSGVIIGASIGAVVGMVFGFSLERFILPLFLKHYYCCGCYCNTPFFTVEGTGRILTLFFGGLNAITGSILGYRFVK